VLGELLGVAESVGKAPSCFVLVDYDSKGFGREDDLGGVWSIHDELFALKLILSCVDSHVERLPGKC
jgi:hypothetical protein